MRFLRVAVSILAAISLVAAVGIYVVGLNDNDPPVITSLSGEYEAEVSCDVTDEELKELVKAVDPQDGDISDRVIVRRNLYFTEKGKVGITFAVCDSDNNVGKLNMNLNYTDYVSPKIEFLDDFVLRRRQSKDLMDDFKVTDVIDGDITKKLKVISADFNNNVAGEYLANCKVTNSHGDTTEMNIQLIVSDHLNQADIQLNKYCEYVSKGTQLDFGSYIERVLNDDEHSFGVSNVEIDASEYNPDKEGIYNIYYRIRSGTGFATMTRMFVIVEGEGA